MEISVDVSETPRSFRGPEMPTSFGCSPAETVIAPRLYLDPLAYLTTRCTLVFLTFQALIDDLDTGSCGSLTGRLKPLTYGLVKEGLSALQAVPSFNRI